MEVVPILKWKPENTISMGLSSRLISRMRGQVPRDVLYHTIKEEVIGDK